MAQWLMGAAVAAVLALPLGARADTPDPRATALCTTPQQVQGFATCADVAKAKQEGALTLYSPAPEPATVALLAAFREAFPEIKTDYVSLQTGALYARMMRERQAGQFLPDVVHLSDQGLVLDFQKRGGYGQYLSPQLPAFKPEYKSQPEGFWTWGAIIMTGIVYNPKFLPADQAPKEWRDLLDPKYRNRLSLKSSNSGIQLVSWRMLEQALGKDFWPGIAKQQPRAFESYIGQYDRIVNGDDLVAASAQYSGYLLYKQKGAPLGFIAPPTGLPAGPEVWGIANGGPHPEASRLFLDWFLSPLGQHIQAQLVFLHSPREDVPPPPGGIPITQLKLLFPTDWPGLLKERPGFVRTWKDMMGLN